MKIDELDLSAITYGRLIHAGIDTVEQLRELSFDDLARIRNMGTRNVEEIMQKLANVPQSNGDRLRGMRDEDLAAWVTNFVQDTFAASGLADCVLEHGFESNILEWLKRPAISDKR